MKDLLLDENGDLLIKNGDFVIGESLEQDSDTILGLTTGQLKHKPLLAPNLIRFMKGSGNKLEVKKEIERAFLMDNKKAKNLKISDGKVTLTPKYK